MKLAFFDNYKLGVVNGNKIVDVSDVVKGIKALGPQDVIRGVIEQLSKWKPKLAAAAKKGKSKPLAKVKLRAPLPKPENIICMAVNYMEDGTLPEPAPINAFMKSPSAVIGPGDTMVLPDMAASVFEGEAELAIVIGKKASKVKQKDAMKYVFGYTNFIDGSARGVVPPTNVFYQMKSRDTFAPIGPVHRHRRRDQERRQDADPAEEQRQGDAELQHRRHGAQDPALHRVGDLDPHPAAGRHPGDRHQPPRPQPVHGRRQDRAGVRGLRRAAPSRCRTSSSANGRASRGCSTRKAARRASTPRRPAASTRRRRRHREDSMLTLYYSPGACSMAAHIILEESGEKYQPQKIDTSKGEQRTPEYLKINPMGRVPALKLDDG